MERPRLVPQLYGYAVCLVCVVTMLIASASLVDGVFDAATPELSRNVGPHLRTFESYREHRLERTTMRRESRAPEAELRLPDDSTLRRAYEDERRFEIAQARFHGVKKIVSSLIVLLVAGAFFIAHWRWVRRLTPVESA